MTDDLRLSEYGALRATIRERGSVRMWVVLAGLLAWAALAIAVGAASVDRAGSLVPLLALAATFEVSYFIHTGVERVGRYLQVFYEDGGATTSASDGWENVVMAYGKNNPGSADPLFARLFAIVAVLDFFTSLVAASRHPGWIAISIGAHAIFLWHITVARRVAANQRSLDLDRFRALKNPPASN